LGEKGSDRMPIVPAMPGQQGAGALPGATGVPRAENFLNDVAAAEAIELRAACVQAYTATVPAAAVLVPVDVLSAGGSDAILPIALSAADSSPDIGADVIPSRPRDRAEIHNIQYLRGLAAVGVLGYHVSEEFGGGFKFGAAGVDLFFIISGCIMWATTAGRPASPQQFAFRRIVRVVPLYWIVTLVTALGILVKPQFFYGHVLTPANFFGSLAFVPVLQDGTFHPVVIQGWTLCYEMMFYGFFAMSLLLNRSWRAPALIAVFAAMAAVHGLLPAGYLRVYTDPVILEFVAGLLIGMAWTGANKAPVWLAVALFTIGLAGLGATAFIAPEETRLIRWGLPAAFIVAGITLLEKARPVHAVKPLAFLGDASYSIYLWHVLLASSFTAIVLRLHLPVAAQPPAIFLACLGAAVILYRLIERPLIGLLRPHRAVRPVGAGQGVLPAGAIALDS